MSSADEKAWLETPLGQYLLLREQAYYDQVAANIFGFNVLAFLFFTVLYIQYPFFLVYTPQQISEEKTGAFTNNLAFTVGQEIRKNSQQGDYIYVSGPEPEIYFYARRSKKPDLV